MPNLFLLSFSTCVWGQHYLLLLFHQLLCVLMNICEFFRTLPRHPKNSINMRSYDWPHPNLFCIHIGPEAVTGQRKKRMEVEGKQDVRSHYNRWNVSWGHCHTWPHSFAIYRVNWRISQQLLGAIWKFIFCFSYPEGSKYSSCHNSISERRKTCNRLNSKTHTGI